MKKILLLLLIVLLLCSCGKESIDSSSANTSSSIKTEISPTYIQVDCDMVVYDNFNELLKNSDCVIVGTVNNILSTFPYYDKEHDTYWTTGDFTGRYAYESSMDEAINNKDIDSLIKSLNIYKK